MTNLGKGFIYLAKIFPSFSLSMEDRNEIVSGFRFCVYNCSLLGQYSSRRRHQNHTIRLEPVKLKC